MIGLINSGKKLGSNPVGLKFFNVYGPNELHKGFMMSPVPKFLKEIKKTKRLKLFKSHHAKFADGKQSRDFIHVNDVVDGIIFSLKNFNKLKSNIYNLGLSSANLTKYMLARKIKKQLNYLKIKIVYNKKDPDQRDYYVSNKKIEKRGFKAKIKIEDGIKELINIFTYSNEKITNNY